MRKGPFPSPLWSRYSNLLKERILSPRNEGTFSSKQVEGKEMRVVMGKAEGEKGRVVLYFVIDENDGVIADAKFQAIGTSALIGAADVVCDMVLRKNYRSAARFTAKLIDRKVRDFEAIPAFPEEAFSEIELVLEAIARASSKCEDISIPDLPASSPVPLEMEGNGEYPDWTLLSQEEKLNLIKEVIQDEVQPYIELDAGGIEVLSFTADREVKIAYQGTCTSCPSATGATLSAIEQILRAKVHPSLVVKPDLSLLSFQ